MIYIISNKRLEDKVSNLHYYPGFWLLWSRLVVPIGIERQPLVSV
jgi:hypothetical protein